MYCALNKEVCLYRHMSTPVTDHVTYGSVVYNRQGLQLFLMNNYVTFAVLFAAILHRISMVCNGDGCGFELRG